MVDPIPDHDDGGYDRLAAWYPVLEWMMFGRRLADVRRRACRWWADCVAGETLEFPDAGDVVLLGDGRGQCLRRLGRVWPDRHFVAIDRSPAMLIHQTRIASGLRLRFNPMPRDARSPPPGVRPPGLIVMPFFSDCFDADQALNLMRAWHAAANRQTRLLHLDFIPPRGWLDRGRAAAMVGLFSVLTDRPRVPVRDDGDVIAAGGWRLIDRLEVHPMIRATYWRPGG